MLTLNFFQSLSQSSIVKITTHGHISCKTLRETIENVAELAIVSDRHASIANTLRIVFPDAHHGACYHHSTMNVIAKFKTDACHKEIHAAACAYRKYEFLRHFTNIRVMNTAIAGYLEGIGIEKWARSPFPVFRYDLMTSNNAESFNSKTANTRS